MGFLRNRLNRRFPRLGLLSDLALVGTAASRLARRSSSGRATTASTVEMALAGGAALRLLQRWRRRRRNEP